MGKQLPPEQLKLYKVIDEILWLDWDPIGVNSIEEARDEYQSYLPYIFRLVTEGKDQEAIAASLISIIENRMGLSADRDGNMLVASKILEAKARVADSKN